MSVTNFSGQELLVVSVTGSGAFSDPPRGSTMEVTISESRALVDGRGVALGRDEVEDGALDRRDVLAALGVDALRPRAGDGRHDDRRQDAEDRHHGHQLDEG